jgi:hypothetical protein
MKEVSCNALSTNTKVEAQLLEINSKANRVYYHIAFPGLKFYKQNNINCSYKYDGKEKVSKRDYTFPYSPDVLSFIALGDLGFENRTFEEKAIIKKKKGEENMDPNDMPGEFTRRSLTEKKNINWDFTIHLGDLAYDYRKIFFRQAPVDSYGNEIPRDNKDVYLPDGENGNRFQTKIKPLTSRRPFMVNL